MTLLLLCLAQTVPSGPAFVQELPAYVHQCTRADETVQIEAVPERPKGELPCQVMMTPSSGAATMLWRVQFERGVCVAKADRKRDLLVGEGWRCETTAHAAWADAGSISAIDETSHPTGETAPDPTRDEERRGDLGRDDLESLLRDAARGQVVSLRLEEAVSLALRNNRDIESGYLIRERDGLSLAVADDQFRPNLIIEGGPVYDDETGASADLSSVIETELPTGGNISLSWANQLTDDAGTAFLSSQLIQPLLRGGGFDANLAAIRQAKLAFDAGRLNLIDTVGNTITSVILAHRALNLAQLEIDAAERALQRAEQQKNVNQQLFEAGRIPRIDQVQTDAEIARLEVDLSIAQLALDDAARVVLEFLDLETRATVRAEDSTTDRDVEITVKEALEIAYAHRADVLSAQLSDQATRLGLAVARSEERWALDALIGADYDRGLYRSEIEAEADFTAGLNLSIPFGDVAREQSVQQARLDIRESGLDLTELTQTVETEIVNVLANVETLKKQIALAERAERLADEQLAAERIRFSRGLSSTLDVIILEDALLDAQRATFQANVDYSNALTELDQALGTTTDSWAIELVQ